MISQMDQIYSNASCTIIAANGDADAGLAGVSSFPRRPQQHVNVQNTTILNLSSGREDLQSSRWASRGWTYQECYLSTRRLIFTACQVVFLCNTLSVSESMQRLLHHDSPDADNLPFRHLVRHSTAVETDTEFPLTPHIMEYSRRELSYSSDSLNAFLGVLNHYTRDSVSMSTSPIQHLSYGLTLQETNHKGALDVHLLWSHENVAIRRPEFPSWAWTGWQGPLSRYAGATRVIKLHPKDSKEKRPHSHLEWKISIEDGCHRVRDIRELAHEPPTGRLIQETQKGSTADHIEQGLQEHMLRYHEQTSTAREFKRLIVSCMVTPVRMQELRLTVESKKQATKLVVSGTGNCNSVSRNISDGYQLVLQPWEGLYVGISCERLELDQQLRQQDCLLGLLFAIRHPMSSHLHPAFKSKETELDDYGCLLVRLVEDGLYERVGLIAGPQAYGKQPLIPKFSTSIGPMWTNNIPMVFLDSVGRILDEVEISATQEARPFIDTAERQTICLI